MVAAVGDVCVILGYDVMQIHFLAPANEIGLSDKPAPSIVSRTGRTELQPSGCFPLTPSIVLYSEMDGVE
jgi:hypothetical protein